MPNDESIWSQAQPRPPELGTNGHRAEGDPVGSLDLEGENSTFDLGTADRAMEPYPRSTNTADEPLGGETRGLGNEGAPGRDDDVVTIPKSSLVRLAQATIVILALVIVGVVVQRPSDDGEAAAPAAAAANGEAEALAATAKPAWPAEVTNRPQNLGTRGQLAIDVIPRDAAEPGAYLWNDYDGWHLWVVPGDGLTSVKGTLTSNDDVAKVELAVPGVGAVEGSGKVISFDLPAQEPLSGIDFNPGFFADELTMVIEGPDGPLADGFIHLGPNTTASSPVVLGMELP